MHDLLLTLIGTASFLLVAVSYMLRSILWLRVAALASGALGIPYNAYLAAGSEGQTADELWRVTFWLSSFFLINVWQSFRLLHANIEVRLPEEDRLLGSSVFPQMRSRDIRDLLASAEQIAFADGGVVLSTGDRTDALYCVARGGLLERLPAGDVRRLPRFSLFGDATWLVQEQYDGSPGQLISAGESLLYRWPYDALRELVSGRPEMSAAIADGIARGMVKKRGFLLTDEPAGEDVPLTLPERRLHAATFGHMRVSPFHALCALSEIEDVPAGAPIEPAGRLGVVERGVVEARREDGHHFSLRHGHLVGEIGFFVPERDRGPNVRLVAGDGVTLRWWTPHAIAGIADRGGALHTGLLQAICRDVTGKLAAPLNSARCAAGAA